MINPADEAFARKLIRPFHDITKEDIDNEMNAIDKLCGKGMNQNIVTVFKHGRLKGSPYYFIDMELCDFNLGIFIYSEYTPFDFDELFHPSYKFSKELRLDNMWKIMMDIVLGLEFIHSHHQVHRDLKPQNGKSSDIHRGN